MIVFWILCAAASAMTLSRYGRAWLGFILGIIFGPFGIVFSFIMRSNLSKKEEEKRHLEQMAAFNNLKNKEEKAEKECPYCAEPILQKARVCKHCGRDINSQIADKK